MGTSKPSVVETNVSQSAGSKSSLAVLQPVAKLRNDAHLALQDAHLQRWAHQLQMRFLEAHTLLHKQTNIWSARNTT